MAPADQPFVWPSLVEKWSDGKITMINEGKGGRLTSAFHEFAEVLGKYSGRKIDILVIELGPNDARDISGNCVPNAVANLRKIISMARDTFPETEILIIGPANICKENLGDTRVIGPQREQNLIKLNAAFKALAEETRCTFFSFYGLVRPGTQEIDGVHPDARGNEPLARRFLEFVAQR